MVLMKYFLSIGLVVILNDFSLASEDPIANTPSGSLKGKILKTWKNSDILAFRNIPYAEPPINQLRFKPPVPAKPWHGIKLATADGPVCPQISKEVGPIDEDCLHLNVFTKSLVKQRHPVIVYFHPGAFYAWTGNSDWFGPEYLLDHDIVLVTINYRLDALGFLSTGDKWAPGNYGLKDQVMALKWIKKHISSFGGDPDKVTLTGYSAGSGSVFHHILSPMSTDLFQQAIPMSGAIASDWGIDENPLKNAKKLATLVNCTKENNKDMIECLRKIPADEITRQFENLRVFASLPYVIFGPVIEPNSGDTVERFIENNPIKNIKMKRFKPVPIITGFNNKEFISWSTYVLNNETLTKKLNNEFETLSPILFGYEHVNNVEKKEITEKIRKFYFNNLPLTKDSAEQLGMLYSDYSIIHGEYVTAKLFAEYSKEPVYFYKFNYKGRFGYANDSKNNTIGPAHHDELLYLLYSSRFPKFNKNDPEGFMVETMTSFWVNFATNRNPNPDGFQNWPKLEVDNVKYLSINTSLSIKQGWPFFDRLKLWDDISLVIANSRK